MIKQIVEVVVEVIKHLPTRHDQKDHGRKRRTATVVARSSNLDVDSWDNMAKELKLSESHSEFVSAAIREGNKKYANPNFLGLRDSSGEMQSVSTSWIIDTDSVGSGSTLRELTSILTPLGYNKGQTVGNIGGLFVAPWHNPKVKGRVKGFGTLMLAATVSKLLKQGTQYIVLQSLNQTSNRYYRKLGMMSNDDDLFGFTRAQAEAFVARVQKYGHKIGKSFISGDTSFDEIVELEEYALWLG